MNYDISIIIVNYNGKKYIDDLFESLMKLETDNFTFEIIFVDNCSTDDSVEYLEKKYVVLMENLKVIRLNKNIGFAGGNNVGVKYSKGRYVVFLNNDTKVLPNWLKELYKCIKQNNAGIVTSKLLFFYDFIRLNINTDDKIVIDNRILMNGKEYMLDPKFCRNMLVYDSYSICFGNSYFYLPLLDGISAYEIQIYFRDIQSAQKLNSVIYINSNRFDVGGSINLSLEQVEKFRVTLIQNAGSGIDRYYNGYDIGFCEEDYGQYEEIREVEAACGAAMIMCKEDFINIGMFDENFFMYYEDTDLSMRMKSMGKKLLYCPTAQVRHVHTGSSKEWSPFFVYYVFRNRMLFILKNYPLRVFIKQVTRFILQIMESLFKKERLEIKRAKLRSALSLFKFIPIYTMKKWGV